jgi:sterol desaturase/sphingolipid hydroxylase (fatty acid hydroxylase superfamily)
VSEIIAWAVPFFLVTLVLEALAARLHPERARRGYEWRDTATSLSLGIANVAVSAAVKLASVGLFFLAWEHRIFDIPSAWWAWVLLFFAEDLCYYAFHRAGHEVRFFWAAHVNHHSSTHYNLSTALRQSWTTPLTGPVFWLPLALLGFHPWMILTQQAISLLYQFWLHTEFIRDLGPFEAVFNTPSHHRVHHGRNVEYLDRNYGGILIVWDRLFGSFERERAAVDYGLTKNLDSFDPIRVGFHEWIAMFRDVRRAHSFGEALRRIVLPPGWSPDGSTQTARELQARVPASSPRLSVSPTGDGLHPTRQSDP